MAIVLELVARRGVRLTHVLETHIHNDYVTGGLELARVTGATYVVAAGDELEFDRLAVGRHRPYRPGRPGAHQRADPCAVPVSPAARRGAARLGRSLPDPRVRQLLLGDADRRGRFDRRRTAKHEPGAATGELTSLAGGQPLRSYPVSDFAGLLPPAGSGRSG
jgi:glyoxylase-like metal-dependent hydrolase (beta-lactamase superfamily II)